MINQLNASNTIELLRNSSIFSPLMKDIKMHKYLDNKNLKKNLIIAEINEKISPDELNLAKKILEAVHINWDNVEFFPMENNVEFSLSKLVNISDVELIMVFGFDWNILGIQVSAGLNKAFMLTNKKLIRTHTLSALNSDDSLKKDLWKALKSQFL